ncbi:MAG TPA: hypothetical protein VMA72_17045 [Streptosporangiaceae bacterium]|nr:hypothetical protein [Streptosporangiaceae bacterium]
MLAEFYLAAQLGRIWLRLHPALSRSWGDGPELCLMAAADRTISPARLWRAQEFSVRVWWRAAMASMVIFFPPAIAISVILGPKSRLEGWLVGCLGLLWAAVAMIAMVQMMVSRYRADQTARYIAKGGTKPLDGYENGYPTRYDFSVGSGLAVLVAGVLGYAGLHSLF